MENDKYILPMLEALVANCIGDVRPHAYLDNTVNAEIIPEDMPFHRATMKSIEWCMGKDLKPTADNVVGHMVSEGIDDAKAFVEEVLLPLRDDDQGNAIKATSAIVGNWFRNEETARAWEEATEIFTGAGTFGEKMDAIDGVLNRIKPDSEKIVQFTQRELYEKFMEEMRTLFKNRSEKGEVGPTLPYEACDAYMSRFKPSEISAFMAYTGWGKTTLVMDIAEYIAWVQDFECDVVVMLLETDPINIQKRQFAKKAVFPYAALESGEIDVDGEYAPKFTRFYQKYIEKNDTGQIHYCYIPEPTIRAILTGMDLYASHIKKTTGRAVVFIVDYLQKIQSTRTYEAQAQHQFYERCVELIASKTRVLGSIYDMYCHTMLFAQENPDTGEVFGTKTMRQKSQLMFSLKRFELKDEDNSDKPVMHRKEHLKDAMGNPRFYHRKGTGLSSRAELHCTKANDSELFKLDLLIETSMGIVMQDRSQMKRLINEGRITKKRKKRTI